jgi:hypothetical protein
MPEPLRVAFVLRKQQFIGVFAIKPILAEKIMARFDDTHFCGSTAPGV